MPKTRPWTELYDLAASQGGFFRSSQAKEIGFSAQNLQPHIRSGRLTRTLRGIYRISHFPIVENENLVELWLWSNEEGVFSHETALAMHELSDALPVRIHMTVPPAWKQRRRTLPKLLDLHFADVPSDDRAWIGLVPVTTPARTLRDLFDSNRDPLLIRQTIRDGVARGLFDRSDLRGIVAPRRGRPKGSLSRQQR